MGRPRKYYDFEIPKTVVEIVKGICSDYERREAAIKHSNITGDVLSRYIELNSAIDAALSDVPEDARKDMLKDVGEGVGYDYSMCSVVISRKTYYLQKRKFVHDVAKKIFLLPK